MANPRNPQQSKAARKRQEDLKEAVVLVPLTFNDGASVPPEVVASILEEVYTTFRGWTLEGTVKGAYRMRSGQKQVEDLLKFSVVLAASQVPAMESTPSL